MKRRSSSFPPSRNLANGEFKPIMKSPEILARGDAGEIAELQAKVEASVCGFINGNTPLMVNIDPANAVPPDGAGVTYGKSLPAFLAPYMTKKSGGTP